MCVCACLLLFLVELRGSACDHAGGVRCLCVSVFVCVCLCVCACLLLSLVELRGSACDHAGGVRCLCVCVFVCVCVRACCFFARAKGKCL